MTEQQTEQTTIFDIDPKIIIAMQKDHFMLAMKHQKLLSMELNMHGNIDTHTVVLYTMKIIEMLMIRMYFYMHEDDRDKGIIDLIERLKSHVTEMTKKADLLAKEMGIDI